MAQGRIRRQVGRAVVCLFLGVVLTVAVAWGCAVWSWVETGALYSRWEVPVEELPGVLRPYLTSDDPRHYLSEYILGSTGVGFGVAIHKMSVQDWTIAERGVRSDRFDVIVCMAGYPVRCLRWTEIERPGDEDASVGLRGLEAWGMIGQVDRERRLPLLPMWPGFVYSVLIYGVLAWFALCALGFLWGRRHFLRDGRIRRGLCVKCAYPMGDFAICPECGKPTGDEA